MRMLGRWWWTTAFALLLGCAADRGAAQDTPLTHPTPPAEAAPKHEVEYRALIKDKFQDRPFEVRGVALYVPQVSLFGGGSGERKLELTLKVGAAELTLPFDRVERIDVGAMTEDALSVKVAVRAKGDAPAEVYEGTIKSSLELRGTFSVSGLQTVVRLREVERVELAAQPE
jgi:hypothetical protein